MRNQFLALFALVFLGLCQTACKQSEPAKTASALTHEARSFSKKDCPTKPDVCATVSLSWPEFSGGATGVAAALNDSVQRFIWGSMEPEGGKFAPPLAAALEKSAADLFKIYREQAAESVLASEHGYAIEVKDKILLENAQWLSLELAQYSDLGGAHPNGYTWLATFDLKTGKELKINDLIADTTALKPLLERGYRATKENMELKDLLFEEFKTMPLPATVALVPEGVRFLYNDYEVAAHAVGPSDFVLTWAELGALAKVKPN